MLKLLLGVLIPFLGTIIGAFMVFFMRDKFNEKFEKILLGFSSGVMIAASIWSLIIPAINQSKFMNDWSFIPAVLGLIFGVIFMLILDKACIKLSNKNAVKAGFYDEKIRTKLLFWAITIHNIPEGMAVGVALASAYFGYGQMTFVAALVLSVGIGVQNIPEGAITSMPLKNDGFSKSKAFSFGVLSGIVEPIFAIITVFLTRFVTPVLPYLLAFAAGAMIFVVVDELIPDSHGGRFSKVSTISFVAGFILMMILDVALG